VNNLHIITLYKLHNKLSCVSSESRRTCRAWWVCRAVLVPTWRTTTKQ